VTVYKTSKLRRARAAHIKAFVCTNPTAAPACGRSATSNRHIGRQARGKTLGSISIKIANFHNVLVYGRTAANDDGQCSFAVALCDVHGCAKIQTDEYVFDCIRG
jgi:hypothetical protein